MKRITVLLACVIGVMFFASCTEEMIDDLLAKKPNVEFVEDEHATSAQTYGIYVNETIAFNVRVSPNEESAAGLSEFIFTIQKSNQENTVVFEDRQTIKDDIYSVHVFKEVFEATEAGNYVINAIVKDEAGAENIAIAYLDVAAPIAEPLGTFTGNLKMSGAVNVSNPLTGSYDEVDLTPMDVVTSVQVGETGENGMCEVIIDIDGNLVTLQCKKDGDSFIFNNFTFTKPLDLNLFTIDFNIEVTEMVGLMHDDVMSITAVAKGNGSYQQLITGTMDGNMEGELVKEKE